jgi:hypothetical protein
LQPAALPFHAAEIIHCVPTIPGKDTLMLIDECG